MCQPGYITPFPDIKPPAGTEPGHKRRLPYRKIQTISRCRTEKINLYLLRYFFPLPDDFLCACPYIQPGSCRQIFCIIQCYGCSIRIPLQYSIQPQHIIFSGHKKKRQEFPRRFYHSKYEMQHHKPDTARLRSTVQPVVLVPCCRQHLFFLSTKHYPVRRVSPGND